MLRLLLLSSLLFVTNVWAQSAEPCPECPECPSCEEKKDLSNWRLSTSLGFNLTRGNSDTLLLNSVSKADREINNHIYHLSVNGSFGRDEDLDDEENGNTSQKKALAELSYKHLLGERLFASIGASAFFDQVADVDYRYIVSPGMGYFILKDDSLKLSVEAGPSLIAEKQGGIKNENISARLAEGFHWQLSDTSKIFQTLELLASVEDSDDTLVTAEAGIEAAINATLSLVVSVKNVYDNLPAADRERNDLTVITGLQANY